MTPIINKAFCDTLTDEELELRIREADSNHSRMEYYPHVWKRLNDELFAFCIKTIPWAVLEHSYSRLSPTQFEDCAAHAPWAAFFKTVIPQLSDTQLDYCIKKTYWGTESALSCEQSYAKLSDEQFNYCVKKLNKDVLEKFPHVVPRLTPIQFDDCLKHADTIPQLVKLTPYQQSWITAKS
jgi:hypothetical protein